MQRFKRAPAAVNQTPGLQSLLTVLRQRSTRCSLAVQSIIGERPSFNFEFEKENQTEQSDSAWGVSTLTTWSRSGLIWQSDQCLLSSFSSSIRSWRLLGWSGSTAKVIIAGDVLWTTQTPLLNISAQYLTVYIHYLQCTCACLAAHSYARTCACTCTCM